MEVLFLVIVFLLIIFMMAKRRPLYEAIFAGLVLMIVLYRFSLVDAGKYVVKVTTSWSSISMLLAFYLVAFFQKILESRKQLDLAQKDLDGIFHNRRINTAGSSIFIGLLPAAAAMNLCSKIVKDASDGYLDKKSQAFVTSWVRHIPESILPTYSSVLLMLSISGVETGSYILGMLIPSALLLLLGYLAGLNKIPKDPGTPKSENKLRDAWNLVRHLWSLMLIVFLILAFKMEVCWSVLVVIFGCIAVYRVKWEELKPMFVQAFERKLLLNTYMVLVLKEFISHTGALEMLPDMVQKLPLPTYMVFGILFFIITFISGSSGAIAVGAPLAFAAIPVSTPLVVFLMSIVHASSQMGLTHPCLVVAAEYYEITLGDMVKKTLPYALAFCAMVTVYYNLWVMFL